MAGLLGDVFSFGDSLKRKARGLLADTVGTLQQFVGNENDRAGRFNQLTDDAATEMQNRIKNGGKLGPNQVKLAGLLADAYNPAGMVVWHGSPHKFTKFDSSKIGTGEGAQAYGHGLYLAESEGVAKSYKDANTFRAFDIAPEAEKRGLQLSAGARGEMIRQANANQDPMIAAKKLQYANSSTREIPQEKLADLIKGYQEAQSGSLYKVDLPDDQIAKMLDWDKPLSQQAPEVQKALQAKQVQDSIAQLKASGQLGDYSQSELQQLRGEDWYDMLRQAAGDSNAAPSDFLRQQGIPGIRYLDGGSRGTGQGTSNFVVFPGNENLLTILERNGQPMNGLLGP